jgi:hypothetical protein
VKVNVTLGHAYVGTERRRKYSYKPFAASLLEWGGLSASRPSHFTQLKDPVRTV